MNTTTNSEPAQASQLRLQAWVDLSYYGLQLRLARMPEKAYLLMLGDTANNDAALTKAGFRRHPTHSYWWATVKNKTLPVADIKRAFPLMEGREFPVSEIVLDVSERAVATTATPPLRIASAAQQGTAVGDAVARLLTTLNIAERACSDSTFDVTLAKEPHENVRVYREDTALDDGETIVSKLLISQGKRSIAVSLGVSGQLILQIDSVQLDERDAHTIDRSVIQSAADQWVRHDLLDVAQFDRARVHDTSSLPARSAVALDSNPSKHVVESAPAQSAQAPSPPGPAAADTQQLIQKDSTHDDGNHTTAIADDVRGGVDGTVLTDSTPAVAGTRPAEDVSGTSSTKRPGARRGSRAPGRTGASPRSDAHLFGDGKRNFRIDDDLADYLSPTYFSVPTVVQDNLNAIRVCKRLSESGAEAATAEDKVALAKYRGWGGVSDAFSENSARFPQAAREVRAALTDEEFNAARSSTVNAHYTTPAVIDALWKIAQAAGFTGGRVLEPGCGVGTFLGRVPSKLATKSQFVAVEKDIVTAGIARHLYPDAHVVNAPFEEVAMPDASVDLVIGNVPFGNYGVFDDRYNDLSLSIHDYFIVKSLDKLRPGGVMAVITSTYTLDKQSPRAREAMYDRADLLLAARLPCDTFKGNAGTEVTTDVLFFRKRLPSEEPAPFDWRESRAKTVGETEFSVNRIFGTKRGLVLGEFSAGQGQYGRDMLDVTSTQPLAAALARMVKATPKDVWRPSDMPVAVLPLVSASQSAGEFAKTKEGNYVVVKDELGQIVNGAYVPVTTNKANQARLRAMIPVREAIKELLAAQLDSGFADADLIALRNRLDSAYDGFVKTFGPLSAPANRRALANEVDLDLLLACEDYDEAANVAKKTEIFTERTLGNAGINTAAIANARDALFACMDERAAVVPDRIAELAGKPWDECREELRGLIFENPDSGRFEYAAKYLSGHVRSKLVAAERAATTSPEYVENVAALKVRLPRDLAPEEIDAKLGAPWIPAADIEDFVRHICPGSNVTVHHNPHTAEWRVEAVNTSSGMQWGTPRIGATKLIETSLRGKAARVMDTTSDGKEYLNAEQTAIAVERQNAIAVEFSRWVWDDPERATRLAAEYNWRFNSYRSPDYSGIPVSVTGMAVTRKLRPLQEKAVVRIVMEDNVLLAHPVGFGKTATMGSAAMKLKELGIAAKSMIVARKNTLFQTAGEIKRWFPSSKVLMIRSEDLNPKGRGEFWRRVQMRSPDVIVVTPEAFKRLRIPKDAEIDFLQEEVAHLTDAIHVEDASGSRKRGRSVKDMEKRRERAKFALQKLLNAKEKDDGRVTLDALGVRALFVDEAQNYKNLQVSSRERTLGVPTAASQRAFDMSMKCWFMRRQGGKVVFATGTPITNTLAEAYNLQRYLSPAMMQQTGIAHFDSWKSQFATLVMSLEPDPGGTGYRTVGRLAEMVNVPELVAMMGSFTDAVRDDSSLVERPTPHFETVVSEPTHAQTLYRHALGERVNRIRGRVVESDEDNILVVLGDARRASLDLRTMHPALPGHLGGDKLGQVAANVAKIYRECVDPKGTQVVFLDFATPRAKGAADNGQFNAYAAIKQGLIDRGIPAGEVAFVHDAGTDAQKADLFARVRAGEVRVLLGSTEKMGEGTNVQDHLIALHHLNAPAHPGGIIQRNGRIIRQGNQNKDVFVYTYVTKGLLEDWQWHLVVLKEKFIRQIFDGLAAGDDGSGLGRRIVEDSATSASFEEIEAAASDNPVVKRRCALLVAVKALELERSGFAQRRGAMRAQLESEKQAIASRDAYMGRLEALARALTPAPTDDGFAMTVGGSGDDAGTTFSERTKAGEALLAAAKFAKQQPWRQFQLLGRYRGLDVVHVSTSSSAIVVQLSEPNSGLRDHSPLSTDLSVDAVGSIRRIEHMARSIEAKLAEARIRQADSESTIRNLEKNVGMEWPKESALSENRAALDAANIELAAMNKGRDNAQALGEYQLLLEEHGLSDARLATKGRFDEFDVESDAPAGVDGDDEDVESNEPEDLPIAASRPAALGMA